MERGGNEGNEGGESMILGTIAGMGALISTGAALNSVKGSETQRDSTALAIVLALVWLIFR